MEWVNNSIAQITSAFVGIVTLVILMKMGKAILKNGWLMLASAVGMAVVFNMFASNTGLYDTLGNWLQNLGK